MSSNFCGLPSPPTSSQPPPDPAPSTVPDHSESAKQTNPNPTRNFDAAGFQEGDQDEPAKKKVGRFRRSDAIHIFTKSTLLDQETGSIDLATGLRDMREDGFARMEKGSLSF
jgi:hypothetical protein